jgi:hypothetical protein
MIAACGTFQLMKGNFVPTTDFFRRIYPKIALEIPVEIFI